MIIRPETPVDFDAIYSLIKTAFTTAEHSDGNEQELVNRLRNSQDFIPELALVAEHENQIVGYILFTQGSVGDIPVLALAPLAVLPEFQHQGIGSALILEGHQRAKQYGFDYVVVLGEPNYYTKFGYQSAENFSINSPFDIPNEYFMALSLNDSVKPLNGVMRYAVEFGIV